MKKMTREETEAKKEAAKKKAAERNCTGKVGEKECGNSRFRTVKKEDGVLITVACRKCGTERDVKKFEKELAESKAA